MGYGNNMNMLNWYRHSNSNEGFLNILSDSDRAFKWAVENLDLYLDKKDEATIDFYQQRAAEYSSKYNSLISIAGSREIDIYRALLIGPREKINYSHVGTHWSFEKDGAGTYGANRRETARDKTIILTGKTSIDNIDWEYGFTSFMYYGEDQWECALKVGSKVTIVAIDNKPIQPILAMASTSYSNSKKTNSKLNWYRHSASFSYAGWILPSGKVVDVGDEFHFYYVYDHLGEFGIDSSLFPKDKYESAYDCENQLYSAAFSHGAVRYYLGRRRELCIECNQSALSNHIGEIHQIYKANGCIGLLLDIRGTGEKVSKKLGSIEELYSFADSNSSISSSIRIEANILTWYKVAQNEEIEARATAFWNEIDSRFPQAEKWKGYPTWDFGNGVLISLTNMARNLYTDVIWSNSKDPEDWITVYLENISSKDRGKGYASLALEELKKIADKHGIVLRLWPMQSKKEKGGLSTPNLRKWYQRREFGEEIGRGNWDEWKTYPEQKPLYLERKPKS